MGFQLECKKTHFNSLISRLDNTRDDGDAESNLARSSIKSALFFLILRFDLISSALI